VWTSKSSVALLIDGENTSFRHMAFIQSHIVQLGILKPRRVYGDWSSGQLRGWETLLSFYGLERRHCEPVAFSKNAADIALVVDAMQLFYSHGIRTFSLVASDSDYTPLVEALCSRGCFVMVLGMAMTPLALQKASTMFVELPALQRQRQISQRTYPERKGESQRVSSQHAAIQKAPSKQTQLSTWLLEGLLSFNASPYAWVQVPRFEKYLTQLDPTFDPKKYGYKNMLTLLRAFPEVFRLRLYRGNAQIYEIQPMRRTSRR
jgi:hypothetical protein